METKRDSIDYRSLTERQQATWAAGDFHEISRQIASASEALCLAVDPHAGQRVLDVACGSGNAALVAARRYCEVTAVDYVPALLERGRMRAAADGTTIDFRVGDAQALPFADASFDVVLSVFGVLFAPDQEKAANEILRVCRPGGKIGLASWIPEGFVDEFFAVHARYAPPAPGAKPAVRWGTEAGLRELLGAGTSSISSERRTLFQHFRSVDHALEVFRTHFGPTLRVLQDLDAAARQSFLDEFRAVDRRYNRAADGTAVLEARYLQTIAIRS